VCAAGFATARTTGFTAVCAFAARAIAKKRVGIPIALLILHVPSGPEGSYRENLAADDGTAAAKELAENSPVNSRLQ
jgi:hypothetical protein